MGKTSDLIEEATKLSGYNLIICRDIRTVQNVWVKILEKKYNLPHPITFDDFINKRYYEKNINAFLIDDADLLLQYISKGVKIYAVSFNKGEEELKDYGKNKEL